MTPSILKVVKLSLLVRKGFDSVLWEEWLWKFHRNEKAGSPGSKQSCCLPTPPHPTPRALIMSKTWFYSAVSREEGVYTLQGCWQWIHRQRGRLQKQVRAQPKGCIRSLSLTCAPLRAVLAVCPEGAAGERAPTWTACLRLRAHRAPEVMCGFIWASQLALEVKHLPANAGVPGSIPG